MKLFILFLSLSSSLAQSQSEDILEVERNTWLEEHNKERDLIGNKHLIWDIKLEQIAKIWAINLVENTCKKDPEKIKLTHSPNRGDIGENLAASWGMKHSVTIATTNWIKEKQWYDVKTNTCEPKDSQGRPLKKSCGHYTQVIAWRSERLGCAKAICPGTRNATYYVCNYAPHGNMIGIPPIEEKRNGN